MPNEARLPLEQQLAARRHAAVRKIEFARGLMKHADGQRREGERELQEIEIAEKVFRELPATESQAMALEASVAADRLWKEAQHAAMADARRMTRNVNAAEIAAATMSNGVVRSEPPVSSSLREMVTDTCMHLLQGGAWKSTEELHQALDAMGVPMGRVQNPVQRVSQILSQDDRFKNQRGRGWALAGTSDEWDQKLQHRTSELLDKDNSAR